MYTFNPTRNHILLIIAIDFILLKLLCLVPVNHTW